LDQYLGTVPKLLALVEELQSSLQVEFHLLEEFWQLSADERRNLVIMSTTIGELAEKDLTHAKTFLKGAREKNFRELHSLEEWISDNKELKDLEDMGIESVETWMIENAKGNIDPSRKSFTLFRSTLDAIPYFTIKHITNGYHNGITHISDLLLEDNKELGKKLRTTTSKVGELVKSIPAIGDERPELPNLGLVNSTIVDAMREGGIYSWAQIIGNAVKEEIELIKGVTWNTVNSLREYADVPMWYSAEIRELGIDKIRKLVDNDVSTIADILVVGDKFREFLGDDKLYLTILNNISRANLNKGQKAISLRHSVSYKVRVKDIPEFEKAGIMSPIDILIGNYDVPKDSPLMEGIENWLYLGDLPVDEINFPLKVIKELKKRGIKKVEDAILVPDSILRDAGASNAKIKAFRKDLNRLKQGDKRSK
jgi:hypothetical protein